MLEIQQIKEQIKRSTDLQATLQNQASTSNWESQTRRGSTGKTNTSSERPSHVPIVPVTQHIPKVFSSLEKREYLKNLKAVVLHVGANNISDAEPLETIVNQLKDTADPIRNVNPEVKILVSSILLRRIDNNVIYEANHSIKEACKEQNYVFIDHDSKFLISGKPNVTLYKDGINLNKKGGKFLGKHVKEILNTIFNSHSRMKGESVQARNKVYRPHIQREGFGHHPHIQQEVFDIDNTHSKRESRAE